MTDEKIVENQGEKQPEKKYRVSDNVLIGLAGIFLLIAAWAFITLVF